MLKQLMNGPAGEYKNRPHAEKSSVASRSNMKDALYFVFIRRGFSSMDGTYRR
jgi:hypothetical protein